MRDTFTYLSLSENDGKGIGRNADFSLRITDCETTDCFIIISSPESIERGKRSMKDHLIQMTYDVELKPGEKLALPQGIVESVGPGHWTITVQPTAVCVHSEFLSGYEPADEGLYDNANGNRPPNNEMLQALRQIQEIGKEMKPKEDKNDFLREARSGAMYGFGND